VQAATAADKSLQKKLLSYVMPEIVVLMMKEVDCFAIHALWLAIVGDFS